MDNEEDRQRLVVERARKRKGRKRDYVSGKQLFESRERERENIRWIEKDGEGNWKSGKLEVKSILSMWNVDASFKVYLKIESKVYLRSSKMINRKRLKTMKLEITLRFIHEYNPTFLMLFSHATI